MNTIGLPNKKASARWRAARAELDANSTALAGASVIVTRPVGGAGALRRRILARGGQPLSLPGMSLRAIRINPELRAGLRSAYAADRVIFTSPAAVRFAFALQPKLRFSHNTRIFAVGKATAGALKRRAVLAVMTPSQENSEGLLELDSLKRVKGLSVATIGASGGRELLAQTLRRRGAKVTPVEVYRRCLPRLDRRHLTALDQASSLSLLLLSSAQSLCNLCTLLPGEILQKLRHAHLVASSVRIAVAAREHGFSEITLAHSANSESMLAAAISALARHRL